MHLTLIPFAFLLFGFLPSECANELSNVLYYYNQLKSPKSNLVQSATSGLDDLKSSLFGNDNGQKLKNQTKSNVAHPHGPRRNETDYHISTWKIYKDYLRKANSVNTTSNNSTSNNSTIHGVSKNLVWKVPHGNNSTSKTSVKNDTSTMPHVEKSNHTLVNISYVDFLLDFANLTVQYLPNVTVTNDSVKIHSTVYDRQLKNRTFKVDYDKNEFMKDGQKFQYASGEMHYFRIFQDTWRRKMRAMRAAGLNVISTYIEWSTHNPHDDDRYVWTGFQDIEKFIRMAIEEDLLVILRPYPYICAERNGGGFPYWLVAKYPYIRFRTTDPNYVKEVNKWFAELMPRFIPYLYENGGPIIMVQVENEYGVYGCNKDYQHWVRDETQKYVRDKAVLFTNDIKDKANVACGKIDGVLATIDFSTDPGKVVDKYWQTLRKYQPNGPCVNSEFYVGWETYWFESAEITKDTDQVVSTLDHQFQAGCSVNIYMFHGGSNYGFSSSMGGLEIGITSYNYNSPIDETGDITDKYHSIRNVIKQHFPMPNIDIPTNEPKMVLPPVKLRPMTTLFSPWSRFMLGSDVRQSNKTLLFETFIQDAGFLLYETLLDDSIGSSSSLTITGLHDRAIVYLNNGHVGSLSRKYPTKSVQINNGQGRLLQILVENLGRQSYGFLSEKKGIIGNVMLNGKSIERWNSTGFAFANMTRLTGLVDALDFVQQDQDMSERMEQTSKKLSFDPIIFSGTFDVTNGTVRDTFIDTRGWGKGFIVINGFNIGRHWPLAGPQMAMYLPKEILKKQNNSIIVVELEQAPNDHSINFIDSSLYMHAISDEI